jgi:hypothetical protein
MPIVKQAIHEHDVVALTQAVNKDEGVGEWPAGTTGTVVGERGEHKLIEISDADGVMLDLVSQTEDRLKLVVKYGE